MNNRQKFFMCKDCENIVGLIRDSESGHRCSCIDGMTELIPQDGSENHCISVERAGNEVKVSVALPEHPMENKRPVEWVYLMTEEGGQRKRLCSGEQPEARFMLTEGDSPLSVYAYCSLHGFWRKEL